MQEFSKDFPYLDIKELIEYYAVFDGYKMREKLHNYENILQNIEENILKKYDKLKQEFIYDKNQKDIEKLLFRIAVGNRKIYSIYKGDISHFHGLSLYKTLFSRGVINKEISREKPIRSTRVRQIKKELRKYQIEDKIKFTYGFYRFWFTFIAPNKSLIENNKLDEVMLKIEKGLDKYVSLTFEELSNRLICKRDVVDFGSYWDRNIELDVLAKTTEGLIIAGECKWKNQKISKNVLGKLQKKCLLANFKVDCFALFSKNGFSNELLKNREKNVLLYDINSFKGLI